MQFRDRYIVYIYRYGNWVYYKVNIPIIRHLLGALYKLLDTVFVRILARAQIPAKCKIGENLYLPHNSNGVIIHADVKIGKNVTISHQVTIGKSKPNSGAPHIGDGVYIGVGAKILGDIVVGDNSLIGANAVVVKDVPPNSTVVGIPAKVIKVNGK
ncbi:serine O-acetyltransferase [Niallia taxi]|uniref:serine O-acetyltransferase n=1 Tax=Niallia taxi TaxID=2499688 RepID=UPI002934196A|nr:serine acetyltransferase [Niallia taxi]